MDTRTYSVSVAIRSNRKAISLSVSRSVESPGSHLARGMFSSDFLVCQRNSCPDYSKSAKWSRIQHECELISRDNDVACRLATCRLYLANNLFSLYRPLAERSAFGRLPRSSIWSSSSGFFLSEGIGIFRIFFDYFLTISFRGSKTISHRQRLKLYHRIFEMRQVFLLHWSSSAMSYCVYVLGDRYRGAATIVGFIAMRMDT